MGPQGRRKERTTPANNAVDGIDRKRKKEQQRGGTKTKDKSLQGTTTLVRVIPVIKKNQSKQSQDNVRSISKGGNENHMQQIRTRPPQEEETSNDDRKKRTKNRTSNQNNHNNNIKTTKHRRHGVGHFLKK